MGKLASIWRLYARKSEAFGGKHQKPPSGEINHHRYICMSCSYSQRAVVVVAAATSKGTTAAHRGSIGFAVGGAGAAFVGRRSL